MILDWTQGVRERHSHGTTIRHFPCPFCGDGSAHLGLGFTSTGSLWANCLRCGASALPHGWTVQGLPSGSRRAPGELVGVPGPTPGSPVLEPPRPLGSLGRSSWAARLRWLAEETWPNLPWSVTVKHAHASLDDPLALWFPYRTIRTGEQGWFIRRFTAGKGAGKARNLGPHEPSFLPGRMDPPFIVVEGMADALAVPPKEGSPVILFGTGTSPDSLTPLLGLTGERVLTLCLDGDPAGREAQRKLSRWLLRQGRDHLVVELENGKDPADLGPEAMAGLLGRGGRWVRSLSTV